MLPGFDGFDLCRRLRAAEIWVPVLMLTARDESATASAALTSVPTTTWSSRSACSSSRRGCGLSPGATTGVVPAVLSVGDLRLDPATKRAWRDTVELELSPKEFALLEFFLRHPGTVLTRTQIIEAVWDFAYDGTSNVVDQYVNYLRRKIDAPFGHHDLQTVRGMGYRLRDAEGL